MPSKPLPLPFTAKTASGSILEPFLADLAVIRTQMSRGKRKAPLDLEFHLNPASLGVAAVGAAMTVWLLQLKMARKVVTVYTKRVIETDFPLDKFAADYIPAGWMTMPPAPNQDEFVLASWIVASNIILPGLNKFIPASEFINYIQSDMRITPVYGMIPEVGHTEYGHFGEPHWIVDVPAHEGVVAQHLHVTVYQMHDQYVNGLESRDGFKVELA